MGAQCYGFNETTLTPYSLGELDPGTCNGPYDIPPPTTQQSGRGFFCDAGDFCNQNVTGPVDGIVSYDNIGLATLTVFTCLTREGWTTVMYYTQVRCRGAAKEAAVADQPRSRAIENA